MKLSVVIVNYNVKFFLAQCLNSLKLSIEALGQETEVFVVDNHSVDGSVQLLKEQYPWVILIENTQNLGFSKANNQAICKATGEYILLLNPDTVLEQDTLKKVIAYMDANAMVGGLGVRMIDGKGKFLPESKRGLPTPQVAFFKITGLSKLFPQSKYFNRYHLGYLDEHRIHEVEVLSGAFMLLRKKVLDNIGLLDETFFMYGEDIDLSYRILQAGYKNVYFPETTIIHYKGESTKKGSINYVRLFYSAMAIFAEKHFSSKQSKIFSFLINCAIWFRAFIAIAKRIFLRIAIPLFDFIIILLSFYAITLIWQQIKFHGEASYPQEFIWYILPIYSLLMLFSLYYMGFYSSKPYWRDLFKGLGMGSLLILSLYALLSEDLRYSRAIVLLGLVTIGLVLPSIRYLLSITGIFAVGVPKKKRAIIIASSDEYLRISQVLTKTNDYEFLLKVSAFGADRQSVGNINDIEEIVEIHKAHEIIFSSKELSPKFIIELMTRLSEKQLDFKIVGDAVIGSKTVYTDEPTFDIYINSIAKPLNKRNKRIFDVLSALLLLILMPISIFMVKNKFQFLKNVVNVILGKLTWIGYAQPISTDLPRLKPCVVPVSFSTDKQHCHEMNLLYAKDFKMSFEMAYLYRNLKKLDRITEN
ncbi:MAG: glycosyltransferase family 2 protein [Bacteroidales bacterium]|nr:glycosyltransferase family 2 protein [Bacteroidales bacterium]